MRSSSAISSKLMGETQRTLAGSSSPLSPPPLVGIIRQEPQQRAGIEQQDHSMYSRSSSSGALKWLVPPTAPYSYRPAAGGRVRRRLTGRSGPFSARI